MSIIEGYNFLQEAGISSRKLTPNSDNAPRARSTIITGTRTDLRKLTIKQMTTILRSYGMKDNQIAPLRRWDRVHVIRELSTRAANERMVDESKRFGALGYNESAKSQAPIVANAEKNTRVLSHDLFGYGKIVTNNVGGSPTMDDADDHASVHGTPTSPENFAAEAMVPYDPISEEWKLSSTLEREVAWLAEESRLLMPSSGMMDDSTRLPLVLDFAWTHGSLRLRHGLMANLPSEVNSMLKLGKHTHNDSNGGRDGSSVVVDGSFFLSPGKVDGVFDRLRGDARDALRLGYRRTEMIEIALGARLSMIMSMQKAASWSRRRPISRLKNGDIIWGGMPPDIVKPTDVTMTSSSFDAAKTSTKMDVVALSVPPELNDLEEEAAWLVEESLIFMPHSTVSAGNDPACPSTAEQTKMIISSGPTQPSEVNWPYVCRHASVPLGKLIERVGDRRPLQRIIRSHDKEVRVSFTKRRDEIFRLILGGYRRFKTQHDLPNHESLVNSGVAHILEVRHARYRNFRGGFIQEALRPELSDMTNSPRKRKKVTQRAISDTIKKVQRC